MGVFAHSRPHALNAHTSSLLASASSRAGGQCLPRLGHSTPKQCLNIPTRSLAGKVSFGGDEQGKEGRLGNLTTTLKRATEELISGNELLPAVEMGANTSFAASTSQTQSETRVKANIGVQAEPQAKVPSLPSDVPKDVLTEFEHKLEADVSTVGITIVALLGVITFWRGVWALLDHFIGDSVFGDICCVIAGLSIVLYIRLSGYRIASFWPNT